MTGWRPTAALGRAAAIGVVALVLSLAAGRPALAAFAVPFLIHAGLGFTLRPREVPTARSHLDHRTVFEGQATTARLELDSAGAEHVARAMGRAAHVAVQPECGAMQVVHRAGRGESGTSVASTTDDLPISIRLRRWGQAVLGEEKVAFTSPWAGFHWGPVSLGQATLTVLPARAPTGAGAPAPHPVGLVGVHRARRPGSGVELSGIRPFTAGDRLRRIHWRHSLRAAELHTIVSDAEEDASVLLVVDATADHGRSGGVGGSESSLDITVRAAAQIADHHLRVGDRVGLRVVGAGGAAVPLSAGTSHTYRILGVLARIRPASVSKGELTRLVLRAPVGTVVITLTPLLDPHVANLAVLASRSGHDTVVVDTMPVGAEPVVDEITAPVVADLAWRMRRLDRTSVLRGLARTGCPVVPWTGPDTLGRVLREMSRSRVSMASGVRR